MNTDTLEFPPIAAPAPRTEVATAAAGALDLERIDLKKLALARFGDWRAALAATTKNLETLALDLTTAAKCKEARSLRQRLIGEPLTEARKVAADTKSKMAATSKAVGAELDTIEADYKTADGLILPRIEAREQELEAERQEKARIEAERVAKHQAGIATIRAYLTRCETEPGMTSLRVANGIHHLASQTFGPEWEEYAVQAANAQCETLEAMRVLQARLLGREQETERQELIRLENERQAEANRIEAKRIADEAAEIRRRAEELDAAERRQRRAEEDARVAALAKQREQDAAALFVQVGDVSSQPSTTLTTTAPVTAAGFASLATESWTDPDPDAATKLPTGEVFERVDAQDGIGLDEVAPAAPALAATMTISQINTRIAPFTITTAALESMGLVRQARPGPAVHFLEADMTKILARGQSVFGGPAA